MTADNPDTQNIPADPQVLLAAAAPQVIDAYLGAFAQVADSEQLASLWMQIPRELERPFLDALDARIAQAEQEEAGELAEGLRERRDALRQMLDAARAVGARIAEDVARLEAAEDAEAVAAIWAAIPIEIEEAFLEAAAQRVDELGDTAIAARVGGQVAALRQERQQREELQRQPPTVRALLAFLYAPDDDAARQIFAERKALLQPYEAQQLADSVAANAPDQLRARFAERAALLRALRGPAPAPQTSLQSGQVGLELERGTGTSLINSAQASDGGTATVYNITNINLLQRSWTQRRPPRLQREVVARPKELDEVRALLQTHGSAVIGARTLGVHGMAGVGKTTLANLLALDLEATYPDGVIWEVIGPEIRSPDQVQPILDRWGMLAVGVEFDPKAPPHFEAEAVRALLGERPRLLVVLDNVWSRDAIAPLQIALPPEAHLLITTRSRQLLTQLQAPAYLLDVLRPEDAYALTALRLGWGTEVPASEQSWVDPLIGAVGRHTLALDVALGMLRLQGETAEEWAADARQIGDFVRSGAGFGDLQLGAEDREHHVELVLQYSYDHALDEASRRRFRLLGAFALSAEFSTLFAAALWDCEEGEARRQLNGFVNAALLSRGGAAGRWQQHALLRGYALALLRRMSEYEPAASRYAREYGEAMRSVDDRQQFYLMLDDVPQLRHAFGWALANDLARAQQLIGACAELQAAFGLAREALDWCERALEAAQRRGTSADVARAWGSLGNALGRVATLAGEDRRARLLAALAAYDEALRFYTPESAPLDYAMTQNNRATLLSEIATLAGEDRRARLLAALVAYDEALRFRTPESATLDYAMTQGNLLNLYQALAGLSTESRRSRLRDAVQCGLRALLIFSEVGHAEFQQRAMRQLQNLHQTLGSEEFAALWAELDAGPPPDWLLDTPAGQAAPALPPELQARLLAAGATDDASLQRALQADPELAQAYGAFIAANPALLVQSLLGALLGVQDGQGLAAFWQRLPAELEDRLIEAAEQLLVQARQTGNEEFAAALGPRLDGLRRFRDAARAEAADPARQAFIAEHQRYLELVRAAEASEGELAAWRAAAAAGEALLAPELAETPGIAWERLRASLASTYTSLTIALEKAGALVESLAATERAVALEPESAMWRRNRAGTLIDLGRLDEAEEELARARALEPEAPRLAELVTALEHARSKPPGAPEETGDGE